MKTIKFRIYDKQQNKMIESGATPTMLESFFEYTAVLHTKDEMPYQQFTGLLDKQDKEIYEGDIVKGDWSIVNDIESGVVEFYGGAFRYKPAGLPLEFGYYRKECEIIGNIYQNPELIK